MQNLLLLLYMYAFILGICIASFINVVIYRVPNGLSVAKGRSFCLNCQHTLRAIDLVPVFSWLFLKGKCRYCSASISKQYPIIECIGGILGVLCFHHYGISWMTLLSFTVSMILLAITMIDFDTMTIPNGLIIALIVPAVAAFYLQPEYSLMNRVIGMVSVSGFLLLLTILVPGAFGGGDIKLMFVAGFLLGMENTLLAAFIGIVVAGSYAIYLLIFKKNTKKDHIAFGPYLSIGIFIALLYGSNIIEAYLSLFRR